MLKNNLFEFISLPLINLSKINQYANQIKQNIKYGLIKDLILFNTNFSLFEILNKNPYITKNNGI